MVRLLRQLLPTEKRRTNLIIGEIVRLAPLWCRLELMVLLNPTSIFRCYVSRVVLKGDFPVMSPGQQIRRFFALYIVEIQLYTAFTEAIRLFAVLTVWETFVTL